MFELLRLEFDEEQSEPFIDDQCCANCGKNGLASCPMWSTEDETVVTDDLYKKRQEDSICRNGTPVWCVYWEWNRERE